MTCWEAYEEYQCQNCGELCINRFDESVTKARECRLCHRVPALEEDQSTEHSGPTDTDPPDPDGGEIPTAVLLEEQATQREESPRRPEAEQEPRSGREAPSSGRGSSLGDDWLSVEAESL